MSKYLNIDRCIVYEEKKMKDFDFNDSFFQSFVEAYEPYYWDWIEKKKEDGVFVSYSNGNILGFLKLKIEDVNEDYSTMQPSLPPARRMKISSFKVSDHNHEVSNTLFSRVLNEAINASVQEIYATIPLDKSYTYQLERFLIKRGFKRYGTQISHTIKEDVYILSDIKPIPFILTI